MTERFSPSRKPLGGVAVETSSIHFPSGVKYQSHPEFMVMNTDTNALVQGTLYLNTIELPAGFPINTVYWQSGTTPLTRGTSSHYWVAVFDSLTRALLRQSTDNTSKTIAASSLISDALSSVYVTTYAGQYLVGFMVYSDTGNGGTQPTYSAWAGRGAVNITVSAGGQKFGGGSTSSLTTTAPNPAGAPASTNAIPWMGIG